MNALFDIKLHSPEIQPPSPEIQELFNSWYHIDKNFTTPAYCLEKLASKGDSEYS